MRPHAVTAAILAASAAFAGTSYATTHTTAPQPAASVTSRCDHGHRLYISSTGALALAEADQNCSSPGPTATPTTSPTASPTPTPPPTPTPSPTRTPPPPTTDPVPPPAS